MSKEIMSSFTQFTLPQILMKQAERHGSEVTAIREKAYGIWQRYSWQDYYRYMKHTGLGLHALGLKRGENIGIITNNVSEWLFSELGCQSVGGISLNLFTSSVAEELYHSLSRIKVSYVIAQDQEQVDKLLELRKKLSHVRRVVYIDPTGMRTYKDNPWLLSFYDLLEMGENLDRKNADLFFTELQKGRRDNVAMMIQTSGTTGISKLAMLSHRNITEMASKWIEALPNTSGGNWISVSPPAWIVDQMWGVGVALLGGMIMNFPEMPETANASNRFNGNIQPLA
jgi:long-chain acyl-CoA synthetase